MYKRQAANLLMLNSFVTGRDSNSKSYVEKLSDRELEIFELLGQGRGTSCLLYTSRCV